MSFIQTDNTARSYSPGYFLINGDEECVRETRELPQSLATTLSDGRKIVKMGTFFPENSSSTVVGIVYEDIDVTSGAMPGSVVTKGNVYLDRLPESPGSGVQLALEGKGFTFKASAPDVVRPKWESNGTLAEITLASTEDETSGKTVITASDYTPGAGESYYYKVGNATTAPSFYYGQAIDTASWSAFTSGLSYTITDTYKVSVVSIDVTGCVVAGGTVTADTKTEE